MAENGNVPANGGQGGQGDQGGSAGGTPAGGGQGAAGGSPAAPWFGSVDDQTKGYIENKGWANMGDVVKSYQGAEKLLGVPKDQLLKVPQKPDDPSWNDVYGRLGRPEKPEGYEVTVPEVNGNKDFAAWAQKTFHGAGLSKRQGEGLAKAWNDRIAEVNKANETENQERDKQQLQELKTEWGNEYDNRRGVVQKVGRALGVNEDQYAMMELALGVNGAAKLMFGIVEKFGVKLPDGGNFTAGNEGGGFRGGMTPSGGASRIAELTGDQAFQKRLSAGDPAAFKEWTEAHAAAFPGQAE